MFGSDMALQRLVLAKTLVAGRKIAALEALLAFVYQLMSPKASGCHKLFAAAFVGADMVPLGRVRPFDVLLQMLLFYVVLVTVGVWTEEWALVIVRSEMGCETGWAVESLVAVRISTPDCLEVGRPFSSRTEGRARGVYRDCRGSFGMVRLGIREIVVWLKLEAQFLW